MIIYLQIIKSKKIWKYNEKQLYEVSKRLWYMEFLYNIINNVLKVAKLL